MIKKITLFILIFVSYLSLAQTKEITLTLKDKSTGNVIEGVMVTILRTSENFQSNSEGMVKFKLPKPSKISISSNEYKSVNLNSVTFKTNEIVIDLEQISQDIEDVVITNRQSFSILKTLIDKSMKKLTAPINLKIYSREFFKYNNEYTSYSDGLV